ncbi:hypothetical protein OROGR_000426 [Orobanche gracilis]
MRGIDDGRLIFAEFESFVIMNTYGINSGHWMHENFSDTVLKRRLKIVRSRKSIRRFFLTCRRIINRFDDRKKTVIWCGDFNDMYTI